MKDKSQLNVRLDPSLRKVVLTVSDDLDKWDFSKRSDEQEPM